MATLGCPELIARTRQEYEDIAIRLGNDREFLKGVRATVWKARAESPLFDCQEYTRGLEKLYTIMYGRLKCGESVDHIAAAK